MFSSVAKGRKDWVGIASVMLAFVAIIQTYLISKNATTIKGFQDLLLKHDTLLRTNDSILRVEKGQGGSLEKLLEKNNSIDSLISEQYKDLIQFRKIERLANYNKLSAAVADISDLMMNYSQLFRKSFNNDEALSFAQALNGVLYNQVDNPFLLANDSAFIHWRKLHVEASNAIRMLRIDDSRFMNIDDTGSSSGSEVGLQIKKDGISKLMKQALDLVIWFQRITNKTFR